MIRGRRPACPRALLGPALLLALAAAPGARAQTAPAGASPEELEILARSLRPDGRAELEAQAGPLAQLPLSEVEAALDLAAARVDGKLRLVFTNREAAPLRELVLRLYPSAPALDAGTSLRTEDVRADGAEVPARAQGSVLEVPLPKPLQPGQRTALTLAFHGRLRRLQPGDDELSTAALQLFSGGKPSVDSRRGYGTFAASDAGAVLVDWYPQLAARSGGRWDRGEPGTIGDAARADVGAAVVSLSVPRGCRVAGAGTALGQHGAAGDREVAAFAMAGLRGGLGLAVLRGATEASADVTLPAGAGPAVHLRATSLQGQDGAGALLACARDALRELSRRFGPYPWSDLALAEVPLTGGAGGVELPGLALVARALAGPDSAAPPGMLAFTCHHEVAHQWFPALVGSDPRGAPWVDEALAQHAALLVAEAAAGGGEAGQQAAEVARARFVALNYQGMRLLGRRDGKVARAADSFRDPLAYAGLVYGKAPLFLGRVRDLVGDERHDQALRGLRRAHAFREAPPGALIDAFAAADPTHAPQLRALERRWLREAHGDEDVPPLDPASLMESMGGGAAELQALSGLLRAITGDPALGGAFAPPGQGQPGLPSGRAGKRGAQRGAPPGSIDEKALQQLLRELDKTAPGLRKLIEEGLQGGAGLGQLPDGAEDDQQ